MKPNTRDQIKGRIHELKGGVKEKAVKVRNTSNMETKGQSRQTEEVLEK